MKGVLEKLSIRKATLDDAVLLSVLASTCFYEAYFELDESTNLAGYINDSFAVETTRQEIEDPESTFLVAFIDGKAVGYARLIDNSRVEFTVGTRVIELKRLYILKSVWRLGIGRMLFEYCVNEARQRGFETLWLGVWKENRAARRFYSEFGLTEAGTISIPYGDVVGTNIVLVKRL